MSEESVNALIRACRANDLATVAFYTGDADWSAALCEACIYGSTECAAWILCCDYASAHVRFNFPLRVACEKGHVELVNVLLRWKNVDPADLNNDAVKKAAEYGHVDCLKLLLSDPRVNPSVESNYAIRKASENGHVEVVKLLLTRPDVDPTTGSIWNETNGALPDYALRKACQNGHAEVVKALLKDGRANPNALNGYPLRIARKNQRDSVLELLIKDARTDLTVCDRASELHLTKVGDQNYEKIQKRTEDNIYCVSDERVKVK